MAFTKAQQKEAQEYLRSRLEPGKRVYTILQHCASNGMSRRIRVVCILPTRTSDSEGNLVLGEPEIWDITYNVAQACDWRYNDKHGAIVVGGCGMDMGFHVVYTLSRVLYRDGVPCIGGKCRSNDHTNGDQDRTVGHLHRDGGYALNHSWL